MALLPEPQQHTVAAIHSAYEQAHREGERTYLGMSTFGTECDRALWYAFRWSTPPERHDGRMLRLLATGHREEIRMIEDLRAADVQVDDNDPVTGRQWELVALGGHLRGHMDGRASGFPEAPMVEHVLELKTHNEKSFKALVKDGVAKAKPGHFAQMQLYMHHAGLTRAFYLAHNKNTDELHAERVTYDPIFAAQLVARAERIIGAPRPPGKLHEDPNAKAAFACAWCSARAVCHERAWARTNCRTCIHASPVDGGWRCERFDCALSTEDQRLGCQDHLFIPDLVPGEQIDADEARHTVSYRLPDGSTWVDGRAA